MTDLRDHAPSDIRWEQWLRRWDAQQSLYIEERERRYDVMFSFLDELLPAEITVLDLAAGPGAISERVLRRFPAARSVAVDVDPVLTRLGEAALGDVGGRLTWVRADLTDPAWVEQLPHQRFDAVLSSTATHWLGPAALAGLYRQLAGLLEPGGVLLNGDLLPLAPHQRRIRATVAGVEERRRQASGAAGAEEWRPWWDALRAEPSLQDAFRERDRIFAGARRRDGGSLGLAFHEAALTAAGFDEVAVIWQDLEERLLLALR